MLNLAPPSPLRRKLGVALVGAIALAGAGAVWAASPPRVIGTPDWVQKPTGEELVKAYPKAAADAGKEGLATIKCTVRADGTLRDCTVIKQAPAKLGFGHAALNLSTQFRMTTKDEKGRPTAGAKVTIPIKFALAG